MQKWGQVEVWFLCNALQLVEKKQQGKFKVSSPVCNKVRVQKKYPDASPRTQYAINCYEWLSTNNLKNIDPELTNKFVQIS